MDWRKLCLLSVILVFVVDALATDEPAVYYFGGQDYITYDVAPVGDQNSKMPINISFRARQQVDEGVIFYSHVPPGDILVVEMREESLFTDVYYANPKSSDGMVTHHLGTGLGLPKQVEWMNVSLKLDESGQSFSINLFESFSYRPVAAPLAKVYIGGYDRSGPSKGIKSKRFFQGCIEDFTLNGVNVFEAARNSDPAVHLKRRMPRSCPLITSYMTFHGLNSYLRIPVSSSAPSQLLTHISFEFSTFDYNASLLLLYLGAESNITFEIQNNKTIVATSQSGGFGYKDVYQLGFNAGSGEFVKFSLSANTTGLTLTVGDFVKVDSMKLPKGAAIEAYYIGGFPGQVGYQGCFRELKVNRVVFDVETLSQDNVKNVTFGSCELIDRCYKSGRKNPRCSHGGRCIRMRQDFECDCSGTGYGGSACLAPLYPLSCEMVKYPPNSNRVNAKIDVDGTGPLAPVEVLCSKDSRSGETTTTIRSRLTSPTRVDGYQDPGSYIKNTTYAIGVAEAVGIVDHATTCRQSLEYSCTRSKLMSSPASLPTPYGWWMDRNDEPQYYWAGAPEGSRRCACSNMEGGCLGGSQCNCDAGADINVKDSGYLTNKSHLPVTQVRFGDTGTDSDSKFATYTIGDVECSGNVVLDNQVSIRRLGSSIKVDRYLYGAPIDVTFRFKTTIQKAQLFYAPGRGKNDFLSIRLEDAKTISIHIQMSGQYQQRTFPVKLNDNEWHSVYFELNYKQSILNVDGHSLVVWETEKWTFHRGLSVGNPVMLGGNQDGTLGFVGCFRGLVINGKPVDLVDLVTDKSQEGLFAGCTGQCNTADLCKNGGRCREYYATYMCDCTTSAFSGCYCGAAVGVSFKLGSWMLLVIQKRLHDTTLNTLELHFKTTKSQGILAHVTGSGPRSSTDNVLTLEINGRGGVDVSFDEGRVVTSSQDGLADGNSHHIKVAIVRSNDGRQTTLEINADGEVKSTRASATQYIPQRLFLASKSSSSSSGTFAGCIFGVLYNNLPVLKEAKVIPTPEYVSSSEGVILEGNDCGEEEYVSPKPTQPTSTPRDENPTENANYRRPVTITGFGSESLDGRRSGVTSSLLVSHFVNLVCRAEGMPDAMYTIKQNGGDLACPHLQASDNTVLLPLDERMEGQYQCFAHNAWSKSMSDIVTVQTPKIMQVPSVIEESVFMTEGQYVRLRCNVSLESAPEAKTSWEQVDMDNMANRIYQSHDGDLHFLWVLPRDSKVYTCWKVNELLDERVEVKRIQLQVNSVPDASVYTAKPDELVYSSSSPVFGDVGTPAVLECLVAGHPVPNITWSREENDIPESAGIVKHYGRHLTITNFTMYDQGEYNCMVVDRVFATIQLNMSMKPYWMLMPKRIAVYQGQKATLQCKTHPLPEDVTVTREWYLNSKPFDSSANERYELSETRDSLRIKDASKISDIQSFQCNVSTLYGYVFGEGFVNVLLPTTVVESPETIKMNFNTRGTPKIFRVTVSADPGADVTFTWYHNETLLESNDIVKITNQSTQSTLKIDFWRINWEKDAASYAGVYRCEIDDEVQKQNVSGELKIYSDEASTEKTSGGARLSLNIPHGNLFIMFAAVRILIIFRDIFNFMISHH